MEFSIRIADYERVAAFMERIMKELYHGVCNWLRCIDYFAALTFGFLPPHYFIDT